MNGKIRKAPHKGGLSVTWSDCSDMDYEKAIRLLYDFTVEGIKPKNHYLSISHYGGSTVYRIAEKERCPEC